ncbi:hypothetical protein WOLCODRAFT_136760 [Wolfiporia cocos MD-104 SS10]|uniref:F-box domain-containing protein n=1 Tax=Wolfiporia cocos (strain MD-104) TaxID=742152 RepID=A0A2H3JVU3_WOLCO|nr:hypothetical protein WOLCODRAFT_136760 [Wolfiporia cocos MD-104 SS10]
MSLESSLSQLNLLLQGQQENDGDSKRKRSWRRSLTSVIRRKRLSRPVIEKVFNDTVISDEAPPNREATPNRRLPAELCDRIVDFLHDDPYTLAACCLTCRSWVPASRHHLFYNIRLTRENVARFNLILDANVSLGLCVKVVTVDYRLQHKDFVKGVSDRFAKDCAHLEEAIKRLHNVTTLRFTEIHLDSRMTKRIALLSQSLETLEFDSLVICDRQQLAEAIYSLPRLKTLVIKGHFCGTSWTTTIPSPLRPDPPTLSHLFITLVPFGDDIQALLAPLTTSKILCMLKELTVIAYEARGLDALFAELGPALETLTIVMHRLVDPRDIRCNLAQCTNLRRIRFMASTPFLLPQRWHFYRRPPPPQPTWVAKFLSQISTDSVRSVAIAFDPNQRTGLPDLSWVEEMALPLSRPEFKELNTVAFQITSIRYERQLRDYIRRELPELCERDIVTIRSLPLRRADRERDLVFI